jgi:V/A-type H+-transporting ATPase subunit A
MKVVQEIARMRFSISNDSVEDLDRIEVRLERSMSQLGGIYDQK